MNSRPAPPLSATALQEYDAFLSQELPRIQYAPENQPDAEGNHTELFWNLVVGLSKTKSIGLIPSMDIVHYYLSRNAPNLTLPSTLDAGPERMQRLQKQLKTYRVEAEYSHDPTSIDPADWARTRMGLALFEVFVVGGLILNHYSALHDGSVYLWLLFVFPMLGTLCLAGLVDPRIFRAVTKGGENMPTRFKIMGGIAALAGMAVSFYLALFVYHVWN